MGVFDEIERAARAQTETIRGGPRDLLGFFMSICHQDLQDAKLSCMQRLPDNEKTKLHKFLLSSSYLAMTAHENYDRAMREKAARSYATLHGNVFKSPDESHSVKYMEEGYNLHMDYEKMWHGCKKMAIEKELLPSKYKNPSKLSPFGFFMLGLLVVIFVAALWSIKE